MFWKSREVAPLPQEVLGILDDIKNYVGNPKIFSQCDVLNLTEGILYNKSGKEYILAHERSVHDVNDLSFYVDGRKIFAAGIFDKRRRVIWSVYNEAFNYLKIKESQKGGGKEELITEENNGMIRNTILDVMKFLEDGEVRELTNVITREAIFLSVEKALNGGYDVRLLVMESLSSCSEVQLSEAEKDVLLSFYFRTRDNLLERRKWTESEKALDAINNIMLQAKK